MYYTTNTTPPGSYIDEVFAIWQGVKDSRKQFLRYLNTLQTSFKRTIEKSKESPIFFHT